MSPCQAHTTSGVIMNFPSEIPPIRDGESFLQTYLNLTVEKPSKNGSAPHRNGGTASKTPYANKALQNECAAVANAPEGQRNDQLNTSAMKLGQLVAGGALSRDEVEAALYRAAVDAGLDDDEIMPTIHSGMGKGENEPRETPEADVYPGFEAGMPEYWDSALPQDVLPTLTVNGKQLSELRKDAMAAILLSVKRSPRNPVVAQFGTLLARIVEDEEGATRIASCNEHSLRHVLTQVANWQRVTPSKDELKITDVPPPMDVVRDIFHAPPWTGIPHCDGVKDHPVCTPSGIVAAPGYHTASRLFITGDTIPIPGPNVTSDQIEDAKSMVADVFHDFPYVTDSDRAHAYAVLLTSILRPMVKTVPAFVAEAPAPGTGKTLSLKLMERIITGRDASMQTLGVQEEETRKLLLSVIQEGREFIIFDNVTGHVNSPKLAAALTANRWSDRVLGTSQMAEMPINSIFCISGNGLTLSEELFRRSVFMQMDANMERPEDRTGWKHANIEMWVTENRTHILHALLVLVQAWIDKGMPKGNVVMGSYEEWSTTISGVFDVVGWGGLLLENRESIRSAKSPDKEPLKEFVEAWREQFGSGVEVGLRKLFYIAASAPAAHPGTVISPFEQLERDKYQGLLADHLTGNNTENQRRSFGKYLSRVSNQVINGYKIRNVRRSNGDTLWQLDVVALEGI